MTKKKTKSKVPVNERAVLARVNRKLAADNEMLKKYRGTYRPADYYHVDLYHNSILGELVDLEPFARNLGVLAPYEKIAD